MSRFTPTPAVAISLTALFFALGGTAFAVGSKSSPQPRCAPGAVRGVAVTSTSFDLSTLSGSYSDVSRAFAYRWSCTGGKILIRKSSSGGVDIRFVGNPAAAAVVSSAADGTPYAGSVSRSPDGSFHVTLGGSNGGTTPGLFQPQIGAPFTIALL